MKRIILWAVAALFTLPAQAQKNDGFFGQLTGKYADKEGFSASMITSDMFDLYLKKNKTDTSSPVYETLKNLDKIVVVSQNRFSEPFFNTNFNTSGNQDKKPEPEAVSDELHKEMLEHYKNENYTLLKTEKRMGEDIKVYLKKNQDKIESIALVTSSSASTNLIELQGNIDLANVGELNQALNLRGLENLYKINNSGNPGMYGQNFGFVYSKEKMEEVARKQQEIAERQLTFTQEQRMAMEDRARAISEKQVQMQEKMREMGERYKRQPIFLTHPGDTNTVYYLNGKKVDPKVIKELGDEKIKSIEVNKASDENDKTTIRIKTK
jgi:hypothetical protein